MIVLFTDFGRRGPYAGQMEAVLASAVPETRVITLTHDAPAHDPKAAAYLLAAYAGDFPEGSVFLCVVDPGVGGERAPSVVDAGGRWYVGPDNGLFEIVLRRAAGTPRWWRIAWRPERLSASFHGRDLFAPVAARIAAGESPESSDDFAEQPVQSIRRADWPDDLAEVIFIDDFGNAITGLRCATLDPAAEISLSGQVLPRAETFSGVARGEAFWYENANGLVELSINCGSAERYFNLKSGSQVTVR